MWVTFIKRKYSRKGGMANNPILEVWYGNKQMLKKVQTHRYLQERLFDGGRTLNDIVERHVISTSFERVLLSVFVWLPTSYKTYRFASVWVDL